MFEAEKQKRKVDEDGRMEEDGRRMGMRMGMRKKEEAVSRMGMRGTRRKEEAGWV